MAVVNDIIKFIMNKEKMGLHGRLVIVTIGFLTVFFVTICFLRNNGVDPLNLNAFIADEVIISPKDLETELNISEIKSSRADSLRNIIWAFGSFFGLLFATMGIVNSIYRTEQKDREIEQARRVTDCDLFSNAITKLGASEPEVQVGGLYELEFLAKVDLENAKTDNSMPVVIKQALANFIRLKSQLDTDIERSPIETATIILSRTFSSILDVDNKNKEDLDEADLLNLRRTKFLKYKFPVEMKLFDMDLTDGVFEDCSLIGVNFIGSNLHKVKFHRCNIMRANFENADLTDCTFESCIVDERTNFGNNVKASTGNEQLTQEDEQSIQQLEKYFPTVQSFDPTANSQVVAAIIKYCGPALSTRDGSLIACSDEAERSRVAKGFGVNKLGLSLADAEEAVSEVCTQMKPVRFKDRVTFYYLLAKKFDKLHLFLSH